MATKRPLNECYSCGKTWYPRGQDISDSCPRCKSKNVSLVHYYLPRRRFFGRDEGYPLAPESSDSSEIEGRQTSTYSTPPEAKDQAVSATSLMVIGGGVIFALYVVFGLGGTKKPEKTAIHKASLAVAPTRSAPLIPAGLQVVLKRRCKIWGFDSKGKRYLLRLGKKRERYRFLKTYRRSAKIRLSNGKKGWVLRSCLKIE